MVTPNTGLALDHCEINTTSGQQIVTISHCHVYTSHACQLGDRLVVS